METREERNGKRRRGREADRVAGALQQVALALEPLSAEARARVLRAAATLLDVPAETGGGG